LRNIRGASIGLDPLKYATRTKAAQIVRWGLDFTWAYTIDLGFASLNEN
jgi:hypothetical protein